MSMETRRRFQQDIEELKMKVLRMASLTEKAVTDSLQALFERNSDLADDVIEGDSYINAVELEIDRLGLKLMALDQPVAIDLRFILASMRIGAELERIADQAVNVAERALFLNHHRPLPHLPLLEQLAATSVEMVRIAVTAYASRDPGRAFRVCRMDDEADDLNVKVLRHFIDYTTREIDALERSIHMIIVSRCLERVADLATNIAENVIFIVEGENVKHQCQL
jgi:phosphate transport system protein